MVLVKLHHQGFGIIRVQFGYPKRFEYATLPPGFGKITKRNVVTMWPQQSACFMPILGQRHPVLVSKDYFIFHSFKVLLWLTEWTLRLQGGEDTPPIGIVPADKGLTFLTSCSMTPTRNISTISSSFWELEIWEALRGASTMSSEECIHALIRTWITW